MSDDKYVENIGCEKCGSSDGVGVYERADGSYHGKCFACDHHTNEPYKLEESTDEFEVEDAKEPSKAFLYNVNDSSINRLSTRGLNKDTCELYGVRSILSESNMDLVHFYPHTSKGKEVATCARVVDGKKFSWSGTPKDLDFFGQSICGDGGKMIIVTEGACDCLAAKQMLLSLDKNYRVVSLVNGAGSALKDFKNNYEWIESFESIFLAFDQDEPGQKNAEKIAGMFAPNKVKNMVFSEKDPNALLLSGKAREFLSAIFSAKEKRPDGIVGVEDLYDEAIKPPVMGLSWPWPTLTEVTYGYRRGELYGVGAGSGSGKCLAKGTKVRLYNGLVRKVEDIEIGDLLLDEKGNRTRVTHLGKGFDEMYKVSQTDNTSYIVNSEHILSVMDSKFNIIDINVKEAIDKKLYGYNGTIDYDEDSLDIPPYILGIWLGDGHNNSPSLTCGDEEVLEEWIKYGLSIGLSPKEFTGETNCRRINLSRTKGTKQSNSLYQQLLQMNLPFNKHIPNKYLINSFENRLQILAGLLDTDGSLNTSNTYFEFTSKYKELSKTTENLCRSLGYRVRSTIKIVNNKEYYRLTIHGDLTLIPCKVPRKSIGKKSNYTSKITIESIGIGEYFGFTLSESKRFCLENYTITHNTEFFKECIHHTINTHSLKAGVIFLEEPAAKTLKVLAGKKVNKRFHIPADKGGDWTIEELVDGINDLKGKVYLYNHFGSKDWESIKSKIKYMVVVLGIKDIYIDHLTALVAQEDNEYKALNRLMEEMSSLCQELDCTIFYISHLRKANGTSHEEGGRVTADQFKGSGSIVFWSNFLFGLERNQQAEEDDERNTTILRVLKDRNTGMATGVTIKLKYVHETGRWGELDADEYNEEGF